jgi:hypothetical protein
MRISQFGSDLAGHMSLWQERERNEEDIVDVNMGRSYVVVNETKLKAGHCGHSGWQVTLGGRSLWPLWGRSLWDDKTNLLGLRVT